MVIMPKIIPITDLKNTAAISQTCHSIDEPIYITKNGYGDMVIMSVVTYERTMYMNEVYNKLGTAEKQIRNGKVLDGNHSQKNLRESI